MLDEQKMMLHQMQFVTRISIFVPRFIKKQYLQNSQNVLTWSITFPICLSYIDLNCEKFGLNCSSIFCERKSLNCLLHMISWWNLDFACIFCKITMFWIFWYYLGNYKTLEYILCTSHQIITDLTLKDLFLRSTFCPFN